MAKLHVFHLRNIELQLLNQNRNLTEMNTYKDIQQVTKEASK